MRQSWVILIIVYYGRQPATFLAKWWRRWTYEPQHRSMGEKRALFPPETQSPSERWLNGPEPFIRDPVTGLYV